ncbi:MAG TPA: asparagine synthase-related protein [Candidatus Saccharimonadales bacterium]|nr:asparagine synthase-related protein [Candidatus Saccharimonadales bacterium]
MSGYFGMARLDGKPVDRKLLEHVAQRLAFRGPDGISIWNNAVCGGCFTCMDTHSAPQSRQQPVIFGERYFLWGDVRLDGQADLRAQLGDANLVFPTSETSEELLLRAWNRWGEEALARVIGDFSFALWDAQAESLVCARDFVGPRPFYYSEAGNALYFGNTLNVFHHVPDVSRELDEQFIGDFLMEGYSLDSARTAFRDIRRLPAGHLLKFWKDGVAVRRFRKLPVEDALEFSDERSYIEAYLERLRESISDRLPRHTVSLYLSGGLDSSSVCAVVSEVASARGQKEKLKAFTLGWEPIIPDPEPALAALTARQLGIAHQTLSEPEVTLFENANSPEWQSPEPDQEYFFARAKRQSQVIAAHSNVVLSGDGGDDVLSGQSWPYLVHLWHQHDWKKIAGDFGGYLWRNQRVPPLRAGLRGKLRSFLRPTDEYAGYPRWLNADFEARLHLRERWRERAHNAAGGEHPLHPQAYRALHGGYWSSVLETEDAGWNGVLLEHRAPLLDLRMLRFMLRLPPVPWCMDKELVRRAMAHRLPDAVVHRPKTPLGHDPLARCTLPSGWPGALPRELGKRIETFVNWDEWCETLSEREDPLSWLSLRPISLSLWLNAVENRMGIK